jgi:hypothetical protein
LDVSETDPARDGAWCCKIQKYLDDTLHCPEMWCYFSDESFDMKSKIDLELVESSYMYKVYLALLN